MTTTERTSRRTREEAVAFRDYVSKTVMIGTHEALALADDYIALLDEVERYREALVAIRDYDTEDGHGTIIEGMVNTALNGAAE